MIWFTFKANKNMVSESRKYDKYKRQWKVKTNSKTEAEK